MQGPTQKDSLKGIKVAKILRTPIGKTLFWQEVQIQYCAGQFCDLQLQFQDTRDIILCHKMVLGSVSSLVREAIIMANDEPGEKTAIMLPDADYDSTKGVVDFLYSFLAAGEIPAGYVINKIALDTLAINLATLGENHQKLGSKQADPLSMPLPASIRVKRSVLPDNSEEQCLVSQFWESEELKMMAKLFQPQVLLEKLPKCRKKPKKCPVKPGREYVLSRPIFSVTEEELEKLRNPQLCENILQKIIDCQGELVVDLQKEPMRYFKHYFDWSPFKVEHFAIIGVVKSKNGLEGLTLTHKLKDGEDPFMQYKRTGEAFKNVLGLSTRDAFCHSLIARKLDEERRNVRGKIRPKYVKSFAQYDQEQLKEVLHDPEVIEITRRQPPKGLRLCHGTASINLNKGLTIDSLEHLLVLFILETGEIKARFCTILDDTIEKTVSQLHMLVFHVWSYSEEKVLPEAVIRRRETRKDFSKQTKSFRNKWSPVQYLMIDSPELKALYYKLLDPCLKVDVAQAYLKGELDREQVLNKSVVCSKCGLTFPLYTLAEESRYCNHQRRHYFEDYKCDCGIDFSSYEEKKWHVMLHHDTGRNYQKCDYCPYVNNVSKIKMHIKRFHSEDSTTNTQGIQMFNATEELIKCEQCEKTFYSQSHYHMHFDRKHKVLPCPVCGGDFIGAAALKQHVIAEHPSRSEEYYELNQQAKPGILCDTCGKDFASKHSLAVHHESIHTEISCEICQESFNGRTKLRNHMATQHPEKITCHVCSYCGKRFLKKHVMQVHMKQVHNDGNARKYQCDMCPRTFLYMSGLKGHKITMHLKTLAYKCRVCEEGFYDTSARYIHEKKKHNYQHKHLGKRNILNK